MIKTCHLSSIALSTSVIRKVNCRIWVQNANIRLRKGSAISFSSGSNTEIVYSYDPLHFVLTLCGMFRSCYCGFVSGILICVRPLGFSALDFAFALGHWAVAQWIWDLRSAIRLRRSGFGMCARPLGLRGVDSGFALDFNSLI